MSLLKHALIPLFLLSGVAAAPLAAQALAAPAQVAAGAKVVDSGGSDVGTVTSLQGDNVVVKTDKHEVAVPKSSFTPSAKGLVLGLTRDQLNAAAEKATAALGPLLSVGATVYDPQGEVVGTVQELDAEAATIKLPKSAVKIPVTAFARGPKGPLIGETATSLEAKAAAAASK